MGIPHKAARTAISAGLDIAINHAKNNEEQGINDIINLFNKYFKPTEKDKKMSGGNAFSGIAEATSDPNSKWMRYAKNLIKNVDPKIVKTLLLNLGYEAGYRGLNTVRESSEKYDCNVPWTMMFDPTSACNMHCKGCWSGEYGPKHNLSFEDMDSIVSQGKELGTHMYLLTGGEPLVRKADLIKLAKKHNDCIFHCFTNGTLVDEAFCKEMLACRNIILAISLEGFKEQNDFRRGEGCFDKVMASMDLLKKYKLPFGTSVCWTSKNCETVISDEFLQLLVNKGCLWAWYFHFMPVGQNTGNELIPTPEQREFMLKTLRKKRRENNDHLIVMLDFQNDGEFVGGCIAGGKHFLHINPNGDVEPCVFIHYSTANIHENTILEALQQPLFMQYRKNQPFNKNMFRPCPMLENPEFLPKMVKEAKAESTDLEAPEQATHLVSKTKEYAKAWAPVADRLWEERLEEKANKNA
ncbi:MAG: radical SAM protein [Pleomorphochaeta sp.]